MRGSPGYRHHPAVLGSTRTPGVTRSAPPESYDAGALSNGQATALDLWSATAAVGIGELLWDLLPGGPKLGGAPLNTVVHLARLGMAVRYITAVGRDAMGRRARAEVRRLGVHDSLVQTVNLPTGAARVEIDAAGVPNFLIQSPAAYESLDPLPASAVRELRDARVLVFGTLAQRSPGTLTTTRHLSEELREAVRLYDLNLRPGAWNRDLVATLLGLATIAKLNAEEQSIIAREFDLPAVPSERFARAAAARFELQGVCVTRGADGAALLLDDEYAEGAARPVRVVDTVGTGDAFSAGLAAGLVAGWPVAAVLDLGSALAAAVASKAGATPEWDLTEVGLIDA
jgi:fructokinase